MDILGREFEVTIELVIPGQRHESHRQYLARDKFIVFAAADQYQLLGRELATYRNYHLSSRFELLQQWRRDVAGSGGDDDSVEWCMLGPAIIAITDAHIDVVVTQVRQAGLRLLPERRNDFDAPYPGVKLGNYRRLVAGAGADFEDAVARFDIEQIGHNRDDVWLRNGLAMTNR